MKIDCGKRYAMQALIKTHKVFVQKGIKSEGDYSCVKVDFSNVTSETAKAFKRCYRKKLLKEFVKKSCHDQQLLRLVFHHLHCFGLQDVWI